ncbi:hypothetical protein, partial [Azospirillum brasilense]
PAPATKLASNPKGLLAFFVSGEPARPICVRKMSVSKVAASVVRLRAAPHPLGEEAGRLSVGS